MKTLVAILAAACVGAGAAWFMVSNQRADQFQKEKQALSSQWQEEKDKLEKDLKRARGQAPRIETVTQTVEVPISTKASPSAILATLEKLKPPADDTERYQTIREIIHRLESLADLGPDALPAIRAFLAQNVDISYERESDNQNDPKAGQPGGPRPDFGALFGRGSNLPRTNYYYPYSLRLGLFEVVAKIGGTQADQILREVLSTTGRGVEVYRIDELVGEKLQQNTTTAAKDLLANPLQVANPTRIDERSKEYCYEVLRKHDDASFLPTAKLLLIDANGHIDAGAFHYITRLEKDAAIATLYQAYNNPLLTNNVERAALVSAAAQYAGPNATANQLIQDSVLGSLRNVPPPGSNGRDASAGFMVIGRLDDGEIQPDVIQSRLALLGNLSQSVAANANPDDRRTGFLQDMIQRTERNLQTKLDPNAAKNGADRRGRGGRGN